MPGARKARRSTVPWALVAVALFVVGALWWLGQAGQPTAPPGPSPQMSVDGGRPVPATPPPPAAARARTDSPAEPADADAAVRRVRDVAPGDGPRVAIIVDDVGYNAALLKDFVDLGAPLTFSVLPDTPHSRELARAGAAAGHEVLLHLPMEPRNSRLDLGPGSIRVAMTDQEIARQVEDDLAAVPQAEGVNNHMGSRATGDERVMRAVLGVLQRRELFFVDSLTTGRSVGRAVAEGLGVPCAVRDVFLDTDLAGATPTSPGAAVDPSLEAARGRLQELMHVARRRGAAIGICHYHRRTAEMLAQLLPELREAGIEVVGVSQVMGEARESSHRGRTSTQPRAPTTNAPSRDADATGPG